MKSIEKSTKVESEKKVPKKKKKHSVLKGILYTFLLIIFFGIISVCVVSTVFFIYIAADAPPFDESKLYTSEPSVIYANNEAIATIGTQDRVLLTYDELPEVLVNAIIATEDSRFFQHNGVDLPRFLVASVKQLLGNSDAGGASTLTMQLSKNTYTDTNAKGFEGIKRKFTDVYLAVFKIEPAYSKEEIIEFYVNSNFLGSGYGVEVTSKNYFGKSAKDLNVAEAAMIAGLFQAPGAYNPYTNPEGTEARREKVLDYMKRHGYIDDEEYEIAKAMTVEKIVKEAKTTDIASGMVKDRDYQLFVDMVIQDVIEKTGESPYTKSMTIYTTMNPEMQKHISNIMSGKTYKWENDKVQAGIAVVDIHTGAIVAVGGSRNINAANTLNRAVNLKNQIGSTAKPLYDYGPAIEYLNWNTGTMLLDSSYSYSDGTKITNADGGYRGWQTITTHLKLSRNIPALKAFQSTSNDDKIKFVTSLGLTPEIYSCPNGYDLNKNKCTNHENPNDVIDAKITKKLHEAHAIGGYNGESPLTMANAYAAFGNGGYYNEPSSFTKIVYNDTGDTYINQTTTKQVMSDSTAYMITNMLQETASYGIDSGSYKDVNGVKYAAKTGTTNFDEKTFKERKLPYGAVRDLWVIGYNTQYSIGVWYGYDKIQDGTNRLSTQHQRLFQAVAKGVFTDKSDFKKPDSVVKITTEANSGTSLLPSKYTPSNYKTTSLFVSGTEPNKVSNKFDPLDDVANIDAYNNGDGTATISWSKISTPDALNKTEIENYLRKGYFPEKSLTSYASIILSNNKSTLGTVGYNVYVQKDGELILQGWTDKDSYQVKGVNGENKIVVKTCYSKYKNNMSSGKSITVDISGAVEQPEPDIDDDIDTDDDTNTDEENSNSNSNSNQQSNSNLINSNSNNN